MGSSLERPWSHGELTIGGHVVPVLRHERCGVAAALVLVPAKRAEELATEIVERSGATPVGYLAWDRARIEAGVPLWGPDFDDSCLPQETGLEEIGISYEKGCYLGQEIIARLHYRGQVSRQLRRIEVAGGGLLPGATISFEDRDAGQLTSVAHDPEADETTAIGMLARRAFEPGNEVVVDGRTGRVALLAP